MLLVLADLVETVDEREQLGDYLVQGGWDFLIEIDLRKHLYQIVVLAHLGCRLLA